MAKQKPATAAADPIFVVFGVPRGGRMPVGARFAAAEEGIARWVARHRGLNLLRATSARASSARAAELAAQLREWQLRANGSPFLPVISLSLWESLRALGAAEGATADASSLGADESKATDPERSTERLTMAEALWAALAVGDTVLAPEYDERGAAEGWWEAAVLAVSEDGVVTTCWLDDPQAGLRRRRRTELAPLHPSAG